MSDSLKSLFQLDPDVVFLNHGSLGACPRPVFEVYQAWQREFERQPIAFSRRIGSLLAESRAALAAYLGVGADDVVYYPNPTTAINVVTHSFADYGENGCNPAAHRRDGTGPFRLHPGDEILTTDHEYGAMDRSWRFICRRVGARYVQQHVPLPVTTAADFVEAFWSGVTERTRVIFLSHITSPTALIFPVAEICHRAREAGIVTVVDGAHAVSQIPLNLREMGVDFYTGACHKWLCAPKGSAFLYARPEVQSWLEPLVVSWGWESDRPSASQFVDWQQWQGTRDVSAFLAVPAAIAFQSEHDWDAVRRRCHDLAVETRRRIHELTGLEPICPDNSATPWFSQMVVARLPEVDLNRLWQRLDAEYHIEVPLPRWQGQPLIRISFQAYNDQRDADILVEALSRLLPELAR